MEELDKVFLRPSYNVRYRSIRANASDVVWSIDAHLGYSVLFSLGGHLAYTASHDHSADEIREGQTLIIVPGDTARITGHRADVLSLTLGSQFLIDCAIRLKLARSEAHITFPERVIKDARLTRFGRDLAEEILTEEAGQEMMLVSLIEQASLYLLRRHAHIRRSSELELSRVGLIDRRIRRAVELMHAQLDRDLPLEEIASAAHLSPFHFARFFKKVTGASPHAYLAHLRIAQAEKLLAETDLSITEIAIRVGHSNPSHFARAFRHATGLTPSAYRQALVSR